MSDEHDTLSKPPLDPLLDLWIKAGGEIDDTFSIAAEDWGDFIADVIIHFAHEEARRPCGLTALKVADEEGTTKRPHEMDTAFIKRIVSRYLVNRVRGRDAVVSDLLRAVDRS
jgi:hypothetical protein